MVLQAVLVAGFDYHSMGKGVDFRHLCDNRLARLIKATPDLTVTIFDVGAGTVVTSAMTPRGGPGKPPKRVQSSDARFIPVSAKNYSGKDPEHRRFDQDQAGVMSIVDVYDYIRGLGATKATAGSLVELSIFSHGFFGGPILVNSDDTSTSRARDPNDKDARGSKDFSPPNMSAKQLAAFATAYAPSGRSWIWGCAFTESYRQVLHQLLNKNPNYRQTKPGKLPDTAKLSFAFTKVQRDDPDEGFYDDDTTFFPQPTTVKGKQVPAALTFQRTFAEVKAFFVRGMRDAYAKRLASASGRPCVGAFVGTYADYEEHDKRAKLPLMVIPRSVRIWGTDFSRSVEFFKTALGVSEDPERRGYAVYLP